ncbi:capsid cement protein [Hydrogenophaga sp.]|uniref:capsid cement protein n=1 Tax=Hydrogenophaga sp. TaxID=1904254 RepID=UPI00271C2707|nr:capsid cement protein [Hydrogenophaga sp.]MDO8903971.1 DUF2190 family protein [Hydrogenophaga sp.]
MNPSISTLALTVIATAALENARAVNQAGAYPAAGGLAFGITRTDAAIGDPTPVDVQGTAIVTAGAAFSKDVPLMVGTNGKLIAHDADGDKHAVARSLEAATADGQLVEVLLVPSSGLLVTAA